MTASAFLHEIHRRSLILSVTGWINVALLAAMLLAAPFETREVMGINVWIKPIKFAASIAIYVWTVAWLLAYVDGARRSTRTIAVGVSIAMLAEIACIALQAARGTLSHYNASTPLDAAIFSTMGGMILVNTLLAAWLLVLAFTRMGGSRGPERPAPPRPAPPALVWGIRLGLIVFVAGSAEGAMMIVRGAHSVGVPDGGPGLPLVNWSTRGGDLRIAHALALHALQILPLAGWWIDRRAATPRRGVALVAGFAALYFAAFGLMLWMALNGRPLLAR
jgi:hypothetical protein